MRLNGITPSLAAAGLLSQTTSDKRKQEWPYPYVYCPEGGQNFNLETVVAFSSNGVQTELWTFTVPDGEFLGIDAIMLFYVGTTVQDGSGLVSWQWDVNIPTVIGAGVTAPILPSGYIVPYFGGVDANGNPTGAITIHKGNPDNGPWPIPGRLVFEPRDQIRIKVTTQNPFPEANGSFLTSVIGWTWPVGG